jgi:hypothetical protein
MCISHFIAGKYPVIQHEHFTGIYAHFLDAYRLLILQSFVDAETSLNMCFIFGEVFGVSGQIVRPLWLGCYGRGKEKEDGGWQGEEA